ncbi:MAG: hypothetical protein JW914_06555 [Syntrophaceae bacterium]|nr:hypothetical protein [Syntrophaceae bacterium]
MKLASLIICIFVLSACQTLPVITQTTPPEKTASACPNPFLKQKTTLIHAIEVHMPGGIKNAVIGITEADPATRAISCAIMTVEGMVLFEAIETDGSLDIRHALPPFDSAHFARNMIEDIKLIFFEPRGKIEKIGFLPSGETACRWRTGNSDTVDVLKTSGGLPEVKRYSGSGKVKRYIKFSGFTGGFYQSIELRAQELASYTLFMNLVEARPAEN